MKRSFSSILALAALATTAAAQMNVDVKASVTEPAIDALKAKGWSILHFVCNLGSFKSIDGEGRLEFSFRGTVLVSRVEGTLTPVGNVRVEFDKEGRKILTGSGSVVVEGKWRGVQWFGSEMRGIWWGKGVLRIAGEFDKNLQTGDFWYENAAEKQSWPPTGSMSLYLPRITAGPDVVPKERKKGG